MRGQVSIELLLAMLAFASILALMMPQVVKAKSVGEYAITAQNAFFLSDELYHACKRTAISGSVEKVTLYASADFKVSKEGSLLVLHFDSPRGPANVSREFDFKCIVQLDGLKKGLNNILADAGSLKSALDN